LEDLLSTIICLLQFLFCVFNCSCLFRLWYFFFYLFCSLVFRLLLLSNVCILLHFWVLLIRTWLKGWNLMIMIRMFLYFWYVFIIFQFCKSSGLFWLASFHRLFNDKHIIIWVIIILDLFFWFPHILFDFDF